MPLETGHDEPNRKQGRPAHVPTPETRQSVEAYVSCGVTHEQISKLLNISRPSLEKHYRTELDNGAAVANGRIAGKLYEKALSGDSACMFFWLKTRARWQEVQRHEHVGDKGNPLHVNHTGPDPREWLLEQIAQVRARLDGSNA